MVVRVPVHINFIFLNLSILKLIFFKVSSAISDMKIYIMENQTTDPLLFGYAFVADKPNPFHEKNRCNIFWIFCTVISPLSLFLHCQNVVKNYIFCDLQHQQYLCGEPGQGWGLWGHLLTPPIGSWSLYVPMLKSHATSAK